MTEWWHRPPWWERFDKEASKRLKQVYWAIRLRCKPEGNYALNRLERWAYTLKAIFCVLLGWNDVTWRDDKIVVAMWDFRKWHGAEFTHYDWQELVVCRDVWQARVETDGAP